MGRQEDKMVEGDAAAKKAKAARTKKLSNFWKVDWEESAMQYRNAVKSYSMAGDAAIPKRIQCLRDSLEPHEKTNDTHTLAKHAEQAAILITEHKTADGDEVAMALYRKACESYQLTDQVDKGAKLLFKVAELQRGPAAIATLNDIIDIFDRTQRYSFGDASFQKCVSKAIEYDDLDAAVAMMRRLIAIHAKLLEEKNDTFENDVYKHCLGIIVVHFHNEEYKAAEADQHQFEDLDSYIGSNECAAASKLLDAMRTGSEEKLADTQKNTTVLNYLPNKLARMAKKLKLSTEVIANPPGQPTLDEQLNGLDFAVEGDGGGDDDDDLGLA